ncbi:SDR family oxidoreductase [Brachyspira aalborgi]|jgi:UDP-glucuronate decarboxylase|uniref:UDP-glucuronate decarboxylase n=1 Tax=Brachyspira aalborgi TaxID=29522 RepID=A0A5C8EYC6_9SPIR|nr:UDP-glucuronic acid decarboxylase family protein [Brachyspira aalborgi]TXJ42609.1 SDR family oxidoreductase [Brachyspira aalborgi]
MKRIIITGGAGFLGSHLCERLLNEGNHIICIDNFFTGSYENIKHLTNNKNFEIIRHDIIAPIHIECDEIYNFACPASPIHYQRNPVHTFKTSVLGILNMLNLARECNARLLQASTSEVYGDPLEHPQKETYWGHVNPDGIRSCYDEGKRGAETLMMDYNRQYKTDIKIIRIFNTYGPRMNENDGRVVSNFIIQALKNIPITVYGDGSQTRSFCYCDDLIDGTIKMMNRENFIGPVNLGNPIEMPVIDFAKIIIEATNSKSEIIFKELPKDDPVKRQPDISLAKEKLNWQPKYNLEDGLKKTIEYFENYLKNK